MGLAFRDEAAFLDAVCGFDVDLPARFGIVQAGIVVAERLKEIPDEASEEIASPVVLTF